MNKLLSFRGLGVAMVTPFKADLSIDIESLKKLSQKLVTSNAQYLTILGTTAETATLSETEKQLVIDTIIQENNGIKGIVIGVGGNNTQEVVNKIKTVSTRPDVNAILSVSPYYNKPSQKGIIEHFTKIADASKTPIILYNVPGRTGSNMTPDTILTLAKHTNIIGIKEASGNLKQSMQILSKKPKDFLFISGDDDLIFAQTALGADGIISVIANAYPNEMHTIISGADGSNLQQARQEHYKLLNIIDLIFKEGNPSGIKVVLKHINICSSYLRLPLSEVSKELEAEISNAIKYIK